MSAIRTRFGSRRPLPDLKAVTIMFQTLILQYLKKLVKSEVRDFPTPEAFHTLKVERLGGDQVEPSAKVCRKFPVPISALVRNFAVKSGEFSERTPPIVGTFYFPTEVSVELTKLFQGLFQGLRMLNLLTRVQGQIGLHTEVRSYTFTCSGQDFFSRVIRDDVEPKRSDSISTNLDITDSAVPIAMVVIQDIAILENELLFDGIPLLERQANRAFRKWRGFLVGGLCINLVSCLELRRTVFMPFLELRGTDTSTTLAIFDPIKESLVGDMDTDNHRIERVTPYPHSVFLGALEQLRQVRLQPIPTGILPIDAVISLLKFQEVVMDIGKVIQHVAQAHILRMLAYLIFAGSHGVTRTTSF